MTVEVSKQSAYLGIMQENLTVTKQSAYVGFVTKDLYVTKQSAYIGLFPKATPPAGRRRMPLIIN